MIAPKARMSIWLKKNDVCMNKQMQIRCSENLEVTNSMIARTNRIAKARLKFGSNDARKHLQRQKERITMKTMSRASWKRKSGRLQPIDSRNNENLEATNNMSARTNRIAKRKAQVRQHNLELVLVRKT